MSILSILIAAWAQLACVVPQAGSESAAASRTGTVAEVFGRVHSGVVTLRTVSRGPTVETFGLPVEQEGTGSGVVVSREGHVLTAAHVVQTASEVVVMFFDGTEVPARIVSSDPLTDLALVQMTQPVPQGTAVAELGDSNSARIGSRVFAVGAPLGISHTLTVGHLSARRIVPSLVDSEDRVEVLQTDAAINPGNSGGPLFDMNGRVIGIISYISTITGASQGLGFAVSSNACRERFFERPPLWSGMEFISLRGRFAEILNVPKGSAALLVQSVVEGSPADRLGLKGGELAAEIQGLPLLLGGDCVLAVNGIDFGPEGARAKMERLITDLDENDELEVTILRAGKQKVLKARWGDLR